MYTAPIVPAQNAILTEVNSTFVTLAMDTWLNGGCPVASFDVALQLMGDKVWRTVENSIAGNTVSISLSFMATITRWHGSARVF